MEEAIINNDIDTIKYLLDQGFDPNHKDETGTPLLFKTHNLEILKILLDYGADSKCVDENGFMLEDYCDNDETLSILNKPRNAIVLSKSKIIKYNTFFNDEITETILAKHGKQDIIVACNCLAHIDNINSIYNKQP